MIDVPEQQHEPRERARLYAQGHRIDNGSSCVLLVIQALDGWSIYGLDPDLPGGVRVSNDAMVTLAKAIVQRAQ